MGFRIVLVFKKKMYLVFSFILKKAIYMECNYSKNSVYCNVKKNYTNPTH